VATGVGVGWGVGVATGVGVGSDVGVGGGVFCAEPWGAGMIPLSAPGAPPQPAVHSASAINRIVNLPRRPKQPTLSLVRKRRTGLHIFGAHAPQ
jgi:hypothetical protein